MLNCETCGEWYNSDEQHKCNPETLRVHLVMKEYDTMLQGLREEFTRADGTVTPEELDAIAKDLHIKRIEWLKTKGITDEELEDFKALSKAFGRPQFKLGKTTISFARAELRDLLYYRLLNDEQLIDSWKGSCFCTCHGGVSLNDLQQIQLMEQEMSTRPEIEKRTDELKEWYTKMEQEDPFNECPPTCDDCLYTDDEKEKKTVCPGCPNYVCEHGHRKDEMTCPECKECIGCWTDGYRETTCNTCTDDKEKTCMIGASAICNDHPDGCKKCYDDNEKPKLPDWIVNEKCQKPESTICNLGYACDGCPYLCDHDYQPTDTEGKSMECSKCGHYWVLGDKLPTDEPAKEPLDFDCRHCGETITLTINIQDYIDWQNRKKLIQDAFPYLKPAERELIKSEMCGKCWDKMFGISPFNEEEEPDGNI